MSLGKSARLGSVREIGANEARADLGYEEWICYIKHLNKCGVVFGENKFAKCLKVKGEGLVAADSVRPATEEEIEQFQKK